MAETFTYPQAPALTDEELRSFLHDGDVARLATHNEDGTIHIAPVWYLYDEPDILLGTQAVSRKVRNVERDPQVTVLFDVTGPALIGVVVYGTARVERDGVAERRTAIFRRYMDEEAAGGFTERLSAKYEGVIIRVTPSSVVSYDYRKGFPA